jgi:aspartate racemase
VKVIGLIGGMSWNSSLEYYRLINELVLSKAGLLGTGFVMAEQFYRDRLKKCFDIDVVVPAEDEQAVVHQIVYDELCQGKIRGSSRQSCLEIVEKLTKRGAEGIVLGCTELPLLIRPGDVQVPVFDTTTLHAEAAVEMALSE